MSYTVHLFPLALTALMLYILSAHLGLKEPKKEANGALLILLVSL